MVERRSARAFIVLMGVVALFGDMTYEGARGLVGPYLALLGASATAVGFAAGREARAEGRAGARLRRLLRAVRSCVVGRQHRDGMVLRHVDDGARCFLRPHAARGGAFPPGRRREATKARGRAALRRAAESLGDCATVAVRAPPVTCAEISCAGELGRCVAKWTWVRRGRGSDICDRFGI
jgi:hypothetical protein